MKKIIIALVSVIAILLIAAGVILLSAGYTQNVTVTEKDLPAMEIVYEDFTGPYSKTGKVMDDLYQSLKKDGINPVQGIGLYFDNPENVPQDKLRSKVGSVIPAVSADQLSMLKKKYKTLTVPAGKYLYSSFPKKNVFSYMVGPMKVYPVIGRYITEKAITPKAEYSIEIYDEPNSMIVYAMKI